MRKRGLSRVLFFFGFLGILVGLGTGAYAAFGLRPKLAALTGQLQESLRSVDVAIASLDKNSPSFSPAFRAGIRLVDDLPEALIALQGSLSEAAKTMAAAGNTTKEAKKGVSGLVAPKDELTRDTKDLKRTSSALQLLSEMIGQMALDSEPLAGRARDVGPLRSLLDATRTRVESVQGALGNADLPMQATLLGFALSGLYLLLGCLFVSMGVAHRELMELTSERGDAKPELFRLKGRAA